MARSGRNAWRGARALGVVAAVVSLVTGASMRADGAGTTKIRLYDAYGVSAAERDTATVAAGAILREAGVVAAWLDCSGHVPPRAVSADCARPPDLDDLIVRLVRAPLLSTPESLGFSYVDLALGRGQLATIYMDRVRAFGAVGPVGASVVLGRAIAHEVVHLLLGTTTHAPAGLMRHRWSVAELQAADPRDWRVDVADRDALRARLQERLSTAESAAAAP